MFFNVRDFHHFSLLVSPLSLLFSPSPSVVSSLLLPLRFLFWSCLPLFCVVAAAVTCCSAWLCPRSVAHGIGSPLDLTRLVFSDEKFFRWNYQGPAQNSPIWVVGAHGRPARKAALDPDMCINEHSQRNPGAMVGVAMVNGIVFPPCFIEQDVRFNTDCYIRMLDDVYLPHCMARLGTDTSSWWWQEGNGPITH